MRRYLRLKFITSPLYLLSVGDFNLWREADEQNAEQRADI